VAEPVPVPPTREQMAIYEMVRALREIAAFDGFFDGERTQRNLALKTLVRVSKWIPLPETGL
jgi:hypothetical protein